MNPKELIYKQGDFTGFCENITDQEYHSNKKYVGSSSLRKILESPKSFYYDYFLKQEKAEKEHLRYGKIVHAAILEPDRFLSNYIEIPNFGDQRAKKNKEAKEAWFSDVPPTAIPIESSDLQKIQASTQAILEHADTKKYFGLHGKPMSECSGFYVDKETQIKLKVRPDYLDEIYMVDVKTTRDSSLIGFGSSFFNYRYDVQLAYYLLGVEKLLGYTPKVVVLAIKNDAPYECAYYEVPYIFLENAKQKIKECLSTLRICIDEDYWPQRQRNAETIYCPQWFINKEVYEGSEN